ncbi:MAG TPA: nuclear transport factor 2 family protein [Methylomirabilota bacterium]|nr:nuclear transport factor 2 family protein [Methylomirabilota bacterium]
MDHASAADLLDRYKAAWESFDGDAWTDLFTADAEYHRDPFEPPLVGSNALRAYLLKLAESQDQVEMTVERHWAVGETVLAAWHASYVQVSSRARVRVAGFMTLEIAAGGRVSRYRGWWHRREAPVAG